MKLDLRSLLVFLTFISFAFYACNNESQSPEVIPSTDPIPSAPSAKPSTAKVRPLTTNTPIIDPPKKPQTKGPFKGKATYYHDMFNGRPTSSGEIYDQNQYTAAIRTNAIYIPSGTLVEVTNKNNGKKVIVKVNDKMNNRVKAIIDLSRQAAEDLDMITDGIVDVTIRVLE